MSGPGRPSSGTWAVRRCRLPSRRDGPVADWNSPMSEPLGCASCRKSTCDATRHRSEEPGNVMDGKLVYEPLQIASSYMTA
jgi:hypothetical protein